MSIKYIDKAALCAWSPIPDARALLALGSLGTTDNNDMSSGYSLDIYTVQGKPYGDQLSPVCQHRVDSPFRSIAWANIGTLSHGIIAGGMSNGHCTLWDVSRLVHPVPGSSSPVRNSSAVLFSQDLHKGQPVSCLEFNPQKPSLLGTGGCDGSVQVLNIERPQAPDVFRGVTTVKHANSEVHCLSWNRKVQHILATASNQGMTVVWDLKNKKEVVTIKDPSNRSRCSALSWNPDIPTQLMIAYNDDQNPCVQLWDMRNCSFPFREFQEHSRGVTCASFCDLDSNFLVSSGRDNKSICWSLHSGGLEPYSELNINSPALKLDWSPLLPGFIAASSQSGTVSVHSIAQRQSAQAAQYPPKWARVPCGVSFGFGGRIVTFGSKGGSKINLHIVPDEPDVVQEADKFEHFLASDLHSFCVGKADETQDEHDRLTWTIISILHEGPAARRRLVNVLGMDMAMIQRVVEQFLGRSVASMAVQGASGQTKPSVDSTMKDFNLMTSGENMDPDQLDSLFDEIAKNSEQQQVIQSQPTSRRGTPKGASFDVDDELNITDWSQGPEAIIKQSIIIGDIPSAVECCMKCGRYADALFLAAGGGEELWKRTRDEYARKQKDPFIKLVGHVLAKDLDKFVQHSDLTSWVETLAILVTYAPDGEFSRLVESLATRLENERFDVRSAVLCYLSCGSFANTVRIWASMSHGQGSQSQALQDLVEKMSCLFNAVRPSSVDTVFAHKVLQYSTLLANSGRIVAAMRCLLLVPDSPETRILKDRIFNAAPSLMGQLVRQPPSFPFEVLDIHPIHTGAVNRHNKPQQHNAGYSQSGHGVPVQGGPSGSAQSRSFGHPQGTLPPTSNAPVARGPGSFAPQHPMPPAIPPSTPGHIPVHANVSHAPEVQTHNVPSRPPHAGSQFQPSPPVPLNAIPARLSPAVTLNQPAVTTPQGIPSGVRPSPTITQGPALGGYANSPAPQGFVPAPMPQRALPQHGPSGSSVTAPYAGTPVVSHTSSGVPGVPIPPASGQIAAPPPTGHRSVVGPPTSSGVSTAPHATANPVTSGMPVSWPIPTPVQQQLYPGGAPPPKSAAIPAPVGGEPVPAGEISTIQRSLTGLLERCAQDGNRKKWEDTGNKLNELYRMLSQGLISRESVTKVKELCNAVDRSDFQTASRLRVELSASDWEKNRTWLFAIQLLLPK